LSKPLEIGLQLKLPESITRHIQVLRLTVSDSITLFNGQGGEFSASLIEITKNLAVVEIKAFFARESELKHSLTLAQGLPEANKMDWIIEKAVELGATAFIPLAASRSVVKTEYRQSRKKDATLARHYGRRCRTMWTQPIASSGRACEFYAMGGAD
jgi:16S rRNA (uracil1498-N3)-methyltransferase